MAKSHTPIGSTKTTRLRKVTCSQDCGMIARVSRSTFDRGLMTCPCGGKMWPDELNDVLDVLSRGLVTEDELRWHPAYESYQRECASVLQGQQGHRKRLHGELRTPDEIAAERVEKQRRERALATQLAAARRLAPEPEPIPF